MLHYAMSSVGIQHSSTELRELVPTLARYAHDLAVVGGDGDGGADVRFQPRLKLMSIFDLVISSLILIMLLMLIMLLVLSLMLPLLLLLLRFPLLRPLVILYLLMYVSE